MSLFASAAFAFVRFLYDLTHLPATAPLNIQYVPPRFDPFTFARSLLSSAFQVVPVFLVAHLAERAGRSMREFGFDLTRPRRDAVVGTLYSLAWMTGGLALYVAVYRLGVPVRDVFIVNADAHVSAVAIGIASAAATAVTEEVIANAYLISRLRELGRATAVAISASALLRASYHLYQGWSGFASNVLLGAIAGALYVRTRRIMPIVIAHFLYDVVAVVVSLYFSDQIIRLR